MPDYGWDLLKANGPYKTILADPPWTFKTYSNLGKKRSAENHYNTLNFYDLCHLSIQDLCDKDCVLFLWVTDPLLSEALEIMEAWGFTYKTIGFYWAKLNKSGNGFFTGLGFWTRANCEQCLLGVRGKPTRLDKGVKRLVIAPRRAHSEKPEEVQTRIEKLVPGPYCELFARRKRPNWHCWGAECPYSGLDSNVVG